jgi:hypothetical protein
MFLMKTTWPLVFWLFINSALVDSTRDNNFRPSATTADVRLFPNASTSSAIVFESFARPENTETENTETENTEPESTELENQSAFKNIEVFIAADKYGTIPLKALATSKFSRWANTSCGSPVFHEVIEKVMTSVPSHETTLREVIADVSRGIFSTPSKTQR